jgi:hypothetical protein
MMRRAGAFLSTFGMFSLGKSRFTVQNFSHVIVNNLVVVDFGFPVMIMMMMMMRSIVFDSLPEPNPRKDLTIDS